MNIPSFIYAKLLLPSNDMTPEWQMFFSQLITELQTNLSDEGYIIPSLSESDIALLTDSPEGTLVFDSTNNWLTVNVNGIFQPITTGVPFLTLPVSIPNGGTDADNAPDALVNLGALPTAGGTMTGNLILAGNPTSANMAANMAYVDAQIGSAYTADEVTLHLAAGVFSIKSTYVGQTSITTLGTITSGTWNGSTVDIAHGGTNATTAPAALTNLGALPLAGGTMTGNLILNGDPTLPNQAATMAYVQAQIGSAYVADEVTLHLSGNTFSIKSTYVGQTSLTTLGTITTGVWNGTAITDSFIATPYIKADGTRALTGNWSAGAFSATFNSVIVGSAANTINGLATIINGGTLTLPTSTDTILARNTTDTLTNKSMSGLTNTFTNIPDAALSLSYLKADGTRALTGNWAAGAFSATFNSVIVGSSANTISNCATIFGALYQLNINTTGAITIPNATDTLTGKATTDVFTNKTYDTAGTGNVFKINGTTVSSVTGTGSVAVLSNSPALTTPTATSLGITGTAGSGFIDLASQSAAPILVGTNSVRLFSSSTGMFSWTQQNDLFIRFISSTLTATRTFTLPDANGTFTLLGNSSTGSGDVVLATAPTITNASLVTPGLGVATATSINKLIITAPATSATLTIANGKTLTASNTLTFTGTDGSSIAFGTGGTVAYVGGSIGVATATSLEINGTSGNGFVQLDTQSATPSAGAANSAQLFSDGSGRFCFVAATDGFVRRLAGVLTANRTFTLPDQAGTFTVLGNSTTGSGNIVLDTAPTITNAVLVTPTLGAISATSATLNGTAGAGFLQLNTQSAAPTISTSNCAQMFTDSNGRLCFQPQTDGFIRRFAGALTANRIITFPDAAGTLTLLGNSSTGSGAVVLDTNAVLTTPTATSMNMNGVNGAGFLQLNSQVSGTPTTGASNSVRLFASSGGLLSYICQNDGFIRFFSGTFTANRTITFQNVTGTVYVTGGTNVAIADGGTGAGTAAAARSNLGINLDSARNYSDHSALGFGAARTPSATNDTLVVCSITITEAAGNSGTVTAQIDGTTDIAKVSLNNNVSGTLGSIITINSMTFICPANSSYQLNSAGGGTRSLTTLYELTL